MSSAVKQYYNYVVINFDTLINKVVVEVVNYYHDNSIPLVKINKDFKKIFVHFLIRDLCSKCLSLKQNPEKILFCNPDLITNKLELFNYIDYAQCIDFLYTILKEIECVLPITIYYSVDIHFDEITERNITNDLKYNFDYVVAKNAGTKSLRKLSLYAEQLGLNFLHKDFLTKFPLRKIFI